MYMRPFRDKGIILLLIQVICHAKILNLGVNSELRVRPEGSGSEKGAIL